MKLKRTYIWMVLMIVVFIVALFWSSRTSTNIKEGVENDCDSINSIIYQSQTYDPIVEMYDLKKWDTSNINTILEKYRFEKIDTNNTTLVKNLLTYCLKNGVTKEDYIVKGTTTTIPATDFQPFGQGKCMTDDGSRMIYFKNGSKSNNAGYFPTQPGDSAGYNKCKQKAVDNGASVFGLQY